MTRFLVTVALLAGTGAYVLLHPPENLALGRGVLQACPARFGPWDGTELSFSDAVIEELDADDLLIRRYERSGRVAWLCIVYHRNRRYGAHDPRICYESQGWLIERSGHATVADGSPGGLTVNRFVATRRDERRLVYYWWSTRGLETADAGAFRRAMALTGALEERSWGAFVRVETPIPVAGERAAESTAAEFASRVLAALPAVLGETR